MRKRSTVKTRHVNSSQVSHGKAYHQDDGHERDTKSSLAAMASPMIYAGLLPDGSIKIGWSANVFERLAHLKVTKRNILAVMPGTLEDEQEIHRRLAPHRARAIEYYHQTAEVIAEVNAIRRSVGMPPLDHPDVMPPRP